VAKQVGKYGAVKTNGKTAVINVIRWSLDWAVDPLETTGFTEAGNRVYSAGLKGWEGSFEGIHNSTAPVPGVGSTVASMLLYVSSTEYYIGSALITGVKTGTPADGMVTLVWDFKGQGALGVANL